MLAIFHIRHILAFYMRPELRWAYIVDSLINNHDHHVEPISFMSCEANNRSLQQREKVVFYIHPVKSWRLSYSRYEYLHTVWFIYVFTWSKCAWFYDILSIYKAHTSYHALQGFTFQRKISIYEYLWVCEIANINLNIGQGLLIKNRAKLTGFCFQNNLLWMLDERVSDIW